MFVLVSSMNSFGQKLSRAMNKMTSGSSSRSRGGTSWDHTPKASTSPSTMDYEEEQEQPTEEHTEPQAEGMEIDKDDAPYLDLQDDHE